KPVDEEIMKLLNRSAVPFQAVLTKIDKLKPGQLDKVLVQVRAGLAKHPAAFPELITTSSDKGIGIPTLRAVISGLI
ncbi:MAG: YihA family ribosome biogenesis GTP-binding protein, partial [Planktomarina sp.]